MATRTLDVGGAQVVGALDHSGGADAGNTFATAYLREQPRLRRLVAGMGFDASDADDILQDVFIEASQRPGQYRGPLEAERWLLRVTVNRCLLEYRRRQRFRRAAAEILRRRQASELDRTMAPAVAPLRGEEIESVRQALRELDGSLAAVLVLRYFCECNATEIGEILEVAPATIRSRLRAARLMLAERLVAKGISP